MPRILVRPPSSNLASGELTHFSRVPVDADLARTQWDTYVEAFRSRGWDVTVIDSAEQQPDGVFVEDTMIVFDNLVVVCRVGAAARRGESRTSRTAAETLGLDVADITAPATVDGGDVLKVGRTMYVGASSRTNEAGIAQLRAILEPRGWVVVEVPVTKVLHLKSGVTALPDGTVIGYPPLVDDTTVFPTFLDVPEPQGSAVVVLDHSTVLMSDNAPKTSGLFETRGLDVVTVSVSEFEKLEGCVTCLSVRIRD